MKAVRFLLPFTHGINIQAIEQVMRLAQSRNATIVCASLIPLPVKHPKQGARLEHIQQARDMQRTMIKLAQRYHITLEMHECFSSTIVKSIIELTASLHCESVVLVLRDQKALLLRTADTQQLLKEHEAPFFIIHLPPKQSLLSILFAMPSTHQEIIQVQWYCKKMGKQCIAEQGQEQKQNMYIRA